MRHNVKITFFILALAVFTASAAPFLEKRNLESCAAWVPIPEAAKTSEQIRSWYYTAVYQNYKDCADKQSVISAYVKSLK